MKILVINAGSSSLKYQLIDMDNEQVMAKGLCERIGIEGSNLQHTNVAKDEKTKIEKPMKDHGDAIQMVIDALVDEKIGVIKSMDEIGAVGHRVVHGGEEFAGSCVITEAVMKALEKCTPLLYITHRTLSESRLAKRLCLTLLWLVYSIQHSTRQCLQRHICMLCHMNTTKTTVSESMVSTVQATSMFHKRLLNF